MNTTIQPADSDSVSRATLFKVACVAFLGPFMTTLDSTVVNVSLSTIAQDLHSTIAAAQWVVSAYLLALALMLPLNGWLVDQLGAKRVYLICFSAFTFTSLLCGQAQTMGALVLFRVLQGMSGGLLAPMAQMMIARAAGRHMARVLGYTVVPVILAPILGPVLAGIILQHAAWPWLFYLNLPIGALAVGLAALLLPSDSATLNRRRFDTPGFLLISPGLTALLYGIEYADSAIGKTAAIAGLILLFFFVLHAWKKGENALLDVRLFLNPIFSVASITQLFSNGILFAGQMLVPLYLTVGCGISPHEAGWLIAPLGLGMLISTPMMGWLNQEFGCRRVASGGALLAFAGTLSLVWISWRGYSALTLAAGLLVRGAGMGAINIPTVTAAYAAVPKRELPVATTTLNIMQRIGGPLATTLAAVVYSISPASNTSGTSVGTTSFTLSFVFLAFLHLSTFLSTTKLPPWAHRRDQPSS